MVMDRMTDEIRQEAPWTMLFAEDIVICSESNGQIQENMESRIASINGEKRNESQ